MSMILGGALMGLGQGLSKYADDLSEKAKATASSEQSLKTYRDKKNIDREFKGLPPIEAGMAVEDGRVKTSVSGPSSVRTGGAPRRSSGSPAQPASAPDTTPTATGAAPTAPGKPGPDGRSTLEMYNAQNPDQPAGRVNVPQPSPGGKSLPETMVERFNDKYLKDVPTEDRIRLLRIAENMYGKNATKTEVEAWISNPSNWGIADTENTGPTPAPGFSSDGPARGFDDPALNGATPSRLPPAAAPTPAVIPTSSGAGLNSARDTGILNRNPSPAAGGPAKGAVINGYRFLGGDPQDQNNWEKVQ